VVTLVVVVHDGARLLPALVNAVREQTHGVHRAVGVDTGSQDRSGAVLTELLGPDAVFGMDADTGYGAAVARALQHPAARRPAPGPGSPPDPAVEWIWLLHDDCEPVPDALEQMLRAASRNPSTAVLGPKLMDLADRRVLREAGVTVDRAGRRVTGIEPGEIDQGQHDGNRPVVAVSSAGMLIRRDVWDQVGGFDPNLPLMRDDLDFCWRVHAAGYDVRVITDAVVYHRDMSARQIRKAPAAGGHPRLFDRRGTLYLFAVNVPLVPMGFLVAGGVIGSLVRAAYFLLTKQQRRAWDHLGAVAWLLRHPVLLWRARRRRAADRKHAWSILRGQLPRSRTLARLAESAAGMLSGGPAYDSSGLHHALVDEVGDDLPLPAADSAIRRAATSPGVLLCVGLTLIALVAERSLVGSVVTGSGTLSGGVLVPAWGGASDLWREYLAGYHDAGLGSAASTPPYIGVMAVLATVLAGKPWLAVDVLLFASVPAAGLTAFLATRRLTSVLAARIWLAATYALLPVAMGAVAAGRIGTLVAFVLLPLIALVVARMLAGPPRRARRAAWAAALLIAVAAAFVPLIWPIAVVVVVGLIAARPWAGRGSLVNAAIVAVVPGVVLIPWTFQLFTSTSAFLLEAGVQRPGLASAGLRPESLLLLSPGGPGLPPAWVTAGLVLPAFCALLARKRMPVVYAGWAIALGGLVVALVVSRVRVTVPGGTEISVWPGAATAVAAVGLLLAATPLIEAAGLALGRTTDRHADRRFPGGWRRLAVLGGLAVAASAPVLAAGYWLTAGVRGPVTAAGPQILPPFVAASSAGPDRTRTLVLRPNGAALSYTVLRSTDPVLGEPELTEASSATQALNGVVASLSAAAGGDGGDAGQALSQFDIGYVLLPAPVDQTLARQLDGAAGLSRLTTAPAYDLWQVAGTVARVRVNRPDGTVVALASGQIGVNTVVPPATSGTLVLAETPGGWSATLNGRPLAALTQPADGWAQGFVLPAGGGLLVITRDELPRDLSLGAEAAAIAIVFALALPGTRSEVPLPAAETGAETGAEPARVPGRRRDRASGPKPPRRKRRPQFAFTAARAGGAPDLDPQAPAADPAPWSEPATEPEPEPWTSPAAGYPPSRDEPLVDRGTSETSTSVAAPRRPRGGQHAARHGKPARRWRGSTGAPASPAPPEDRQPEHLDDDEGLSPWTTPDPMTAGPHAPWESGDRS
jgi:GT2 family glycosyltransferase